MQQNGQKFSDKCFSIGKMPICQSETFLRNVSIPRGDKLTENLPGSLPAHPPICFPINLLSYLSLDTGMYLQNISTQIAELGARPSRNPDWKHTHLIRAARNIFWDTKCSQEHQGILLNFISTYIHIQQLCVCFGFYCFFFFCFVLFSPLLSPQLSFFTRGKFCFLVISSRRAGGTLMNFRDHSVCIFDSLVNFLLKCLSFRGQKHLSQTIGEVCRIPR